MPHLQHVLPLLCLALPAFAAPPAERQAVDAAYKQEDTALLKRNVPGFFATHTANYEIATGDKNAPLKRKDYEMTLRQQLLLITPTRATTSVQKVEAKSAQATATVTRLLEGTAPDFQNPEAKQPSRYALHLKMRDVWVKTGAGWRKRRSRLLSMKATVNGQPFALPMPSGSSRPRTAQ